MRQLIYHNAPVHALEQVVSVTVTVGDHWSSGVALQVCVCSRGTGLAARNIMQAEWELFVELWLANLNPLANMADATNPRKRSASQPLPGPGSAWFWLAPTCPF